MSTLYFDPFSGIAGNMTVAALLDAGADPQRLRAALATIPFPEGPLGLIVERRVNSGIAGTYFNTVDDEGGTTPDDPVALRETGVSRRHPGGNGAQSPIVGDGPGSDPNPHSHHHPHAHVHDHDHDHDHEPAAGDSSEYAHAAEHDHVHADDHPHPHPPADLHRSVEDTPRTHAEVGHHDHIPPSSDSGHHHAHHHRTLPEIRQLLAAADLPPGARDLAETCFHELAKAEARVHGFGIDQVSFHEVGARDSIADLAGAAICLTDLGVTSVATGPIQLGSGFVRCAHGTLPVPAPATAFLLEGLPVFRLPGITGELTTPTGAAILRGTRASAAVPPGFVWRAVGHGHGSKRLPIPNLLRVFVGAHDGAGTRLESVGTLETHLDNVTGELLGHAIDILMAAGALDATVTPLLMKKGRPGHRLTVLTAPADLDRLEAIIYRELPTLGVRRQIILRSVLAREPVTLATAAGPLPGKRITAPDGTRLDRLEFAARQQLAERQAIPVRHTSDTGTPVRAAAPAPGSADSRPDRSHHPNSAPPREHQPFARPATAPRPGPRHEHRPGPRHDRGPGSRRDHDPRPYHRPGSAPPHDHAPGGRPGREPGPHREHGPGPRHRHGPPPRRDHGLGTRRDHRAGPLREHGPGLRHAHPGQGSERAPSRERARDTGRPRPRRRDADDDFERPPRVGTPPDERTREAVQAALAAIEAAEARQRNHPRPAHGARGNQTSRTRPRSDSGSRPESRPTPRNGARPGQRSGPIGRPPRRRPK